VSLAAFRRAARDMAKRSPARPSNSSFAARCLFEADNHLRHTARRREAERIWRLRFVRMASAAVPWAAPDITYRRNDPRHEAVCHLCDSLWREGPSA
jgi:hypothetical protein